jgi:chloride channel 3/4/5
MNPFRTNQLVMFQVSFDRPWHAFELPLFVLLGVFGGLYGVLFNRLNLKVNAWRRRHPIKNWPVLEVAAVALITALVGYLNVFSRVSMSELVAELFRECERADFYGLCE